MAEVFFCNILVPHVANVHETVKFFFWKHRVNWALQPCTDCIPLGNKFHVFLKGLSNWGDSETIQADDDPIDYSAYNILTSFDEFV